MTTGRGLTARRRDAMYQISCSGISAVKRPWLMSSLPRSPTAQRSPRCLIGRAACAGTAGEAMRPRRVGCPVRLADVRFLGGYRRRALINAEALTRVTRVVADGCDRGSVSGDRAG